MARGRKMEPITNREIDIIYDTIVRNGGTCNDCANALGYISAAGVLYMIRYKIKRQAPEKYKEIAECIDKNKRRYRGKKTGNDYLLEFHSADELPEIDRDLLVYRGNDESPVLFLSKYRNTDKEWRNDWEGRVSGLGITSWSYIPKKVTLREKK